MPRRTKVQREMHERLVEELLIAGLVERQVVRSMVQKFQLTPRQVRRNLAAVRECWADEDDELRQGKLADRDLAIAADCRERMLRQAFEAKDLRRAVAIEKDRSKLLGLYFADRRREPHLSRAERRETLEELTAEIDEMYEEAPRNPDGSVVLTAYSETPPPADDPKYRRAIEDPLPRPIMPRRQERIDLLRLALAEGVRLDQLEQAAREQFGLSQRQARGDVLLLVEQLEADGERLRHGTHELQSLALALRRRERLLHMARQQDEHRLAAALETDRCRLLGLCAVGWHVPECAKGVLDSPSHHALRLHAQGRATPTQGVPPDDFAQSRADRMLEVEFSRRDRLRGHRHTAAELLPAADGRPTHPGRQPWKPPGAESGEHRAES
jgi:hypothetical protein